VERKRTAAARSAEEAAEAEAKGEGRTEPEEELCSICYASPLDTTFQPCKHQVRACACACVCGVCAPLHLARGRHLLLWPRHVFPAHLNVSTNRTHKPHHAARRVHLASRAAASSEGLSESSVFWGCGVQSCRRCINRQMLNSARCFFCNAAVEELQSMAEAAADAQAAADDVLAPEEAKAEEQTGEAVTEDQA
jgi:hypothetical protein